MSGRNDYGVVAHHGVPPVERYGVAAAAIEKLKMIEVHQNDAGEVVEATYDSAGAITLADYNGFPIGSRILDLQAFKWHIKTAATTWLSSAAMS